MNPLWEKLRRPAKWLAYGIFAFAVFQLSLYVALPRDRIQDLVEANLAVALNADVQVAGFGLNLFSGPGLHAAPIVIKTRPLLADEKPQRVVIDDAVVHFGLYQASRGFADTRFAGHAFGGQIAGTFRWLEDDGGGSLDMSEIQIKQVPLLARAIGLPIEGALEVKGDLAVPKNLLAQASGSASLDWSDAAIGDGKAKLAIQNGDPFLAQGITVPRIDLGRVAGSINIDKGRAVLRDVRGHSKDIDIELEGYIELRDPIGLSLLHLYLKVKPSDALLKREAALELVVTGSASMARRSDGFLGFSIGGVLSSPNGFPAKEAPAEIKLPPPRAAPAAGSGASLPVRSATRVAAATPSASSPTLRAPPWAPSPSLPTIPPATTAPPPPPPSPTYLPSPPPPSSTVPMNIGPPPTVPPPATVMPSRGAMPSSVRSVLERSHSLPDDPQRSGTTIELPVQ